MYGEKPIHHERTSPRNVATLAGAGVQLLAGPTDCHGRHSQERRHASCCTELVGDCCGGLASLNWWSRSWVAKANVWNRHAFTRLARRCCSPRASSLFKEGLCPSNGSDSRLRLALALLQVAGCQAWDRPVLLRIKLSAPAWRRPALAQPGPERTPGCSFFACCWGGASLFGHWTRQEGSATDPTRSGC